MNLSRQAGVALVQVLLMSTLLLLLVVQLSLNAKNSVNLALHLKEKSEASMKSLSVFSSAQYRLLTERQDYYLAWSNGQITDFSGSKLHPEPGVTLQLQDMSGLLSTSFMGGKWEDYLQGDKQKIQRLKSWQGGDDNSAPSPYDRKSRLPYLEEVNLLPGWEDQDLEYITRLPTGMFNVAMTPEALLMKVFPEDVVDEILELRHSGRINRDRLNLIDALQERLIMPRGDFIRVEVSVDSHILKNEQFNRTRLYKIQTGSRVPVLELGIGTQ